MVFDEVVEQNSEVVITQSAKLLQNELTILAYHSLMMQVLPTQTLTMEAKWEHGQHAT